MKRSKGGFFADANPYLRALLEVVGTINCILAKVRKYETETVRVCRVLKIADLTRFGVFKAGPGHTWLVEWVHCEDGVVSDMLLELQRDRPNGFKVRLSYYLVDGKTGIPYNPWYEDAALPECGPLERSFTLTTTPCNLGGKRYWFRC